MEIEVGEGLTLPGGVMAVRPAPDRLLQWYQCLTVAQRLARPGAEVGAACALATGNVAP